MCFLGASDTFCFFMPPSLHSPWISAPELPSSGNSQNLGLQLSNHNPPSIYPVNTPFHMLYPFLPPLHPNCHIPVFSGWWSFFQRPYFLNKLIFVIFILLLYHILNCWVFGFLSLKLWKRQMKKIKIQRQRHSKRVTILAQGVVEKEGNWIKTTERWIEFRSDRLGKKSCNYAGSR